MAFAAINSAGKPIIAIEEAFATEPSLKKRVYDAIGAYPSWRRIYACLHGCDDFVEHTLTMAYSIQNFRQDTAAHPSIRGSRSIYLLPAGQDCENCFPSARAAAQ